LYTRYSRLSNRLYSRFDNRLYRVNGVLELRLGLVSVVRSTCVRCGLRCGPMWSGPTDQRGGTFHAFALLRARVVDLVISRDLNSVDELHSRPRPDIPGPRRAATPAPMISGHSRMLECTHAERRPRRGWSGERREGNGERTVLKELAGERQRSD